MERDLINTSILDDLRNNINIIEDISYYINVFLIKELSLIETIMWSNAIARYFEINIFKHIKNYLDLKKDIKEFYIVSSYYCNRQNLFINSEIFSEFIDSTYLPSDSKIKCFLEVCYQNNIDFLNDDLCNIFSLYEPSCLLFKIYDDKNIMQQINMINDNNLNILYYIDIPDKVIDYIKINSDTDFLSEILFHFTTNYVDQETLIINFRNFFTKYCKTYKNRMDIIGNFRKVYNENKDDEDEMNENILELVNYVNSKSSLFFPEYKIA